MKIGDVVSVNAFRNRIATIIGEFPDQYTGRQMVIDYESPHKGSPAWKIKFINSYETAVWEHQLELVEIE